MTSGDASPAPGPDPDRFAALLCDWCLEVSAGQQILISSTTGAVALMSALHRAVLDRDAWPLLRITPPGIDADFFDHAQPRHLDGYAAADASELESVDATLRIDAPADTSALAGIDPAVIQRAARARAPLRTIRSRKRWCMSVWPTPALARQAGLSEHDHAAFVTRALLLDREDPISAWRALSATQAGLVRRLGDARRIRIEADGTDVTLDVSERTWINSDGRRNMPSGEVFTGPHERSANGTIRFTVPTGPAGLTVTGVQLTFVDGEVVDASAEQGQTYLDAALATDDGARRLGELGIGTNAGIDRATGHVLLDEKIAGTVHLALGRSYPETGGCNVSTVHWDLICDLRDGGRLSADGQPIVLDGRLL